MCEVARSVMRAEDQWEQPVAINANAFGLKHTQLYQLFKFMLEMGE